MHSSGLGLTSLPPPSPGVPDEAASARFRGWTERLSSVISDMPLPNMPVGAQLVPIREAVRILKVCVCGGGRGAQLVPIREAVRILKASVCVGGGAASAHQGGSTHPQGKCVCGGGRS